MSTDNPPTPRDVFADFLAICEANNLTPVAMLCRDVNRGDEVGILVVEGYETKDVAAALVHLAPSLLGEPAAVWPGPITGR